MSQEDPAPVDPMDGDSTADAALRPITIHRLRLSMGTLVAIEATATTEQAAGEAIEGAFGALAEAAHRLHPRNALSDLRRINDAPLRSAVEVHASTAELLTFAQRLHSLTGGVFDPCLRQRPGRVTDIEIRHASAADAKSVLTSNRKRGMSAALPWRGLPHFRRAAVAHQSAAPVDQTAGVSHYVICHAPVALDLGGFAKGYAVDRAIEVLIERGCSAGLVNAGGDLRVFGDRKEPLLLRRADGNFRSLELIDAAIAVSDTANRERPLQHQGYYNPLHGKALQRPAAPRSPVKRYAAVVAAKAMIADALTKCVLLCPKGTASRALREFAASQVSDD